MMRARGYEGVMAKHGESPYLPGKRSPYWLKVKATRLGRFLAVELTQGKGRCLDTFGALVLVAEEGDSVATRRRSAAGSPILT